MSTKSILFVALLKCKNVAKNVIMRGASSTIRKANFLISLSYIYIGLCLKCMPDSPRAVGIQSHFISTGVSLVIENVQKCLVNKL